MRSTDANYPGIPKQLALWMLRNVGNFAPTYIDEDKCPWTLRPEYYKQFKTSINPEAYINEKICVDPAPDMEEIQTMHDFLLNTYIPNFVESELDSFKHVIYDSRSITQVIFRPHTDTGRTRSRAAFWTAAGSKRAFVGQIN